MKTVTRRLTAILAAVCLAVTGLLASPLTAMAEDPTTGTITLNTQTDDSATHSFSGWHLATLENVVVENNTMKGFLVVTDSAHSTEIQNAMAEISDKSSTATWKDQWEAAAASDDTYKDNPMAWLIDKKFKAVNESSSPWGGGTSSSADSDMRKFAEKLADKVTTDATATLSTGKNENLAAGIWFLKDTTTDLSKATRSIPIITPTSYEGTDWGTVTLKNSVPTIHKKLVDKNVDTNTYSYNKQPDYATGDNVYYELTSTIPVYTGYASSSDPSNKNRRVFKITDTASKALTVSESDVIEKVVVKKGSETPGTELIKNTDYTVSVADYTGSDKYSGGHVTTIDLSNFVNNGGTAHDDNASYSVTVYVKTTLNASALLSTPSKVQDNPNRVDLYYSNNPDAVSTATKLPGNEVPVYSYETSILKTDRAGNAITYANAKFTIQCTSGTGHNGQYLGNYNAATGAWTYAGANEPTVSSASGVFTTGTDGKISVKGLDSGTYTIREIQAPSGYTSIGLPTFTFKVGPTVGTETDGEHTISDVSYSVDGQGGYAKMHANTSPQIDVWNAKNITELPLTGDVGMKFIYTTAGILMVAGVAFALKSRARS